MVNEKLLMDSVRATDKMPDVRINGIRQSGAVLLEYIGGSLAYGTNIPTSDSDVRGIFLLPKSEYLGTRTPVPQVSDDRKIEGKKKNDDIFYTFRRFFELLKGSNPNILESLYLPKDCVVSSSPEIEMVIQNRSLFISKACLWSHCGYAFEQVKRAKGKNKKVHNPQPQERPKKADFCRVIACIPGAEPWTHPDVGPRFPFRPIPLKDMPWVDLAHYHISSVEHLGNAYRMYYYGEDAKGVFRGDDMLCCESIPKEDEHPRFSGILIYNEVEYEKAVKDWNSYWDWMKNRNEARWIDQEGGKLTFDQKNMMHCVRLLMSGKNILENGEPIIRFSGEQQKYLMAIRNGDISDYEVIMADVEQMLNGINEKAKTSSLPDDVDYDKIEALYHEVSETAWKKFFSE
jgi:predicted nucleotidyltransferase